MSIAFSPGTDFEDVVDGLQPVTLTLRDGTTVEVAGALQHAVSTAGVARQKSTQIREAASADGQVAHSDVLWSLPRSKVSSRPDLGATITDAEGDVWTVLLVDELTFGKRWRCTTRNLVVMHRLDALITIQRASYGKDVHGSTTVRWQNWKPNFRARIHPVAMQPHIENEVLTAGATHLVFLAEDVDLGPDHRIVGSEGKVYQILRAERATQLGELMQVHVQQRSESKWANRP